jgi:Tol biopolymer transport system component
MVGTSCTRSLITPRVSADGRRVAYAAVNGEGGTYDVWVYDLNLGARTRLSNNPLTDALPVWSPDGAQVTFASFQGGNSYDVVLAPVDGSSPPAALVSTGLSELPLDWSRDGRHLVYYEINSETQRDIRYLELGTDGDVSEPVTFLSTPANERTSRLSPDGRFLAYVSDESDQDESYVQPFPDGGRRTTVSTAGSKAPV